MEKGSSKLAYNFADHVIACQRKQGSVLICGLDPQLKDIPKFILHSHRHDNVHKVFGNVIAEFNHRIIDAVRPYVSGFKPQAAFYECFGSSGWEALEYTRMYVKDTGLFCILDAKRGDGGDTASAYAGLLTDMNLPDGIDFDTWSDQPGLDVDCMTMHPWIDEAQMQPILAKVKPAGKGIQIVCKTSFNPPSRVENYITEDGLKVWEQVALNVHAWSEGTEGKEGYGTIGVVLGATREDEADSMRGILPNNLFLIPGYGAQGGGAKGAVRSFNKDGFGGMVNSSRGILYAYKKGQFACDEKDFANAAALEAERSRNELNEALNKQINLTEV